MLLERLGCFNDENKDCFSYLEFRVRSSVLSLVNLTLPQHERDAENPFWLRELGEQARTYLSQTVAEGGPDVSTDMLLQQLEVDRLQEVDPERDRQVFQSGLWLLG